MNKQRNLSILTDELLTVKTKKKEFLKQIDQIIPWEELDYSQVSGHNKYFFDTNTIDPVLFSNGFAVRLSSATNQAFRMLYRLYD